ncbi:MAG: acetyl-CoA decarbonylase/synthase complex subunit delta [Candidatus Omnitrophica bacterium]|nr:acetyl-CoA decarbonylase/synthase complex subunit delta [Candidatus Omnitrophota bacterium]
MELLKEKCVGPINELEIGSGVYAVKVGGQTCMPFLFQEGRMPHAPVTAVEILDCEPVDWPEDLVKSLGSRAKDPVVWAKDVLSETHANMLCVRLQSAHPDWVNRSSDDAVSVLKKIALAVDVPLIVIGCGDDEKDNDLMPKVSQALKGYNALLGVASQNNYKTITATCLADGHSLIAESPIDVNIAKQLNILVSDMGFDPRRIVMHPTTASLGYGMEYTYSIMERSRQAAFMGDKMLAMPFILFIGAETWRTKESKDGGVLGGVNWEIATAVSMLQAGAEILVMRHFAAAKSVSKFVELLMKRGR